MASAPIDVTVFTDPGCPWGYSAMPMLRVLDWRYGAQLRWQLVLIGLAEDPQQLLDRGITPLRSAKGAAAFRRLGMPLAPAPKPRMAATSPGCRLVVAARIDSPGSEWSVLRALQRAQFTDPTFLMDEPAALERALVGVDGIDAASLVGRIDDADVLEAYEADRALARQAAGTPGAMQGKTAMSDGVERYTAPSVRLVQGDTTLEAAGFQSLDAYDVLLANLDPTLERRRPAASAADAIEAFPDGLVTQEVAALLAQGSDLPDRSAAELQLIDLLADGAVERRQVGDDALWLLSAR